MSQEKNSETVKITVEAKEIIESQENVEKSELICHISDEFKYWENKDKIHKNLCEHTKLFEHTDGKIYCYFHLPSEDKNIEEFEKIVDERLKAVEMAFHKATDLPEDDRSDIKIFYDFRYVIFPYIKNFLGYKFITVADFSSAKFISVAKFKSAKFMSYVDFIETTFTSIANFRSATFTSTAEFSFATFTSTANFRSAKFTSDAYFRTATFTSHTYFTSATFASHTYFTSATFTSNTYFKWATFFLTVDFSSAKFLETSQTFLEQTSLQGKNYFRQAVIKGYLYFEAGRGSFFDGEWLDEAKTKPKKVDRETKVFDFKGSLNFAHVKVEKPERITFNRARLKPSWFVNIDSRKFVFTDIEWENHRASESELQKELFDLKELGYNEPHNFQLLTIAFRNLAANAEEFNRFEESSNFRKSASECERLERVNRRKKWRQDLGKHWSKDVICWQFFREAKKTITESRHLLKNAPFDFVHFLYRWLSGYGEKWFRALVWLFVIWFGFAVIYHSVKGFENSNVPLSLWDSIGYSLQVMTLQRPEPRPVGFTRFLYGLETIIAPIQGALLALAIRRKFMR